MHQGGPNQDFPPFLRPMPLRPPFFIREIYKNGFLKRLPYNERKSSALAKLMKSDRFWVVFSVHDDVHPFLELWHEPTEVASKPPQYIFPLLPCLHISRVTSKPWKLKRLKSLTNKVKGNLMAAVSKLMTKLHSLSAGMSVGEMWRHGRSGKMY